MSDNNDALFPHESDKSRSLYDVSAEGGSCQTRTVGSSTFSDFNPTHCPRTVLNGDEPDLGFHGTQIQRTPMDRPQNEVSLPEEPAKSPRGDDIIDEHLPRTGEDLTEVKGIMASVENAVGIPREDSQPPVTEVITSRGLVEGSMVANFSAEGGVALNDASGTINVGNEFHSENHFHIGEQRNVQNISYVVYNTFSADQGPSPKCQAITGDTEHSCSFNIEDLDDADTAVITSSEEFQKTVDTLKEQGIVLVCTLPGLQMKAFFSSLCRLFVKEGYKIHHRRSVCDFEAGLGTRGNKSLVLVDPAFGVVRLDTKQYRAFFKHNMYSVRSLIPKSKTVFVVYPHVLRDLQHSDTGGVTSLLGSLRTVKLCPILHPSVQDYTNFLQSMLSDQCHGRKIGAVLCAAMQGHDCASYSWSQTQTCLREFGFSDIEIAEFQQYAQLLKGFLLAERDHGFINRMVYDAAGFALAEIYSERYTLSLCDIRFLVHHVHTRPMPSETRLVLKQHLDIRLLMQRICKAVFAGHLPEIAFHPCLQDPEFLQEFEAFCRKKGQLNLVMSAVDPHHHLPLFYWSLWTQSSCLANWCLILMKELGMGNTCSSHQVFCTAFAAALIMMADRADDNLSTLVSWLRDELVLLPMLSAKCDVSLPYPLAETECINDEKSVPPLITHLKRDSLCYLGKPSLPIPPQLVSVAVKDGAVQVRIPRGHPYLALRLIGDRQVDEADREGNTLLHIAADCGQGQGVAVAVQSGASLLLKNKKKQMAFQLAAKRIDEHREGGTPCSELWLRFQDACIADDIDSVKILLCDSLTIHDKDTSGRSLLHHACVLGSTEIASLLIKLGAAVNCVDIWKETPLHKTSENRTELKIVKWLKKG